MATGKIDLRTTIKNSPETHAGYQVSPVQSETDPRIGLVLDSKYQLIERLGEGGMGTVYRARRLHIGDEVAVKLLSHQLTRERQAIERFRREARSAASIRHPNVVSIHDFNDEASVGGNNEAYIVMELVKGESLRHLLEREGRLPAERAVRLMLDICAGVGVAHRQGLLHRDLKPDNVIVAPPSHDGEKETAKVVDFGLAKVRDEISPLTQTGTLMGTIYYMSPEQCRGEDLDARADVYSLGAMLYEMLSGETPFRASNIPGLITKHLNEQPPTLDYSLGIPSALTSVCFRALAKSRNDRQADALAFAKELQVAVREYDPSSEAQSVRAATSVSAPHAFASQQSGKSNLSKWIIGGAGVAILVVLLVALGVGIKFGVDRLSRASTATQNIQSKAVTDTNPNNSQTDSAASAAATVGDLAGTWRGTYGPAGTAATLVIKDYNGKTFSGTLEQGPVRVAFEGTIQGTTVTMKQTNVLKGEGWSLGEDTGTISTDGKRMSGTGKDALGGSLGLTYQWSFSR